MIDAKDIEARARGRWHGILTTIGIPESYLTGKHGPCIICNGQDRWRWDDKNGSGSFYCNQCQPKSGSGIALVQKFIGCNFPEALEKIQSIIGGCEKMPEQKPKADPKIALNKVWQASTPLTGSDPVSKYLHSRGLNLQPDNIRFCEKCYESDSKTEMSAMIARVQSEDGRPVSLHRTYLQGSGKADIESPKKLMPGTEPLNGGAVRLFSPESSLFESNTLGIAEGIETAVAATQLSQIATWAAISTSLLESWQPPNNIKSIVIFADRDANFAGQKSAYILANKLYNRDFLVEVTMPDEVGDWNDVLAGKQ